MATRGIWIPIEIMNDSNLNYSQKFILSEIEQLSQLEDGCYAQNSHFADLAGIAKATVSRSISGLEEMGYIKVNIKNGSRNHVRMITIDETSTHDESSNPPTQNVKPPMTKSQETKGNTHIKTHSNTQAFTFTLKKLTEYDNLSEEYKEKLFGACMLVDGKEDRYEDFIITLRSNGYKYKNFPLAYMNWDKERAYKQFTTEVETKLGKDWQRVLLGNGELLAVNTETYETKRGVIS